MLGCGGDDPAARGVVDRAGAEIPAVEVAGDDHGARGGVAPRHFGDDIARLFRAEVPRGQKELHAQRRSEEHTSELQSLMRISYAVFCLKKKIQSPSQHVSIGHNKKKKTRKKL